MSAVEFPRGGLPGRERAQDERYEPALNRWALVEKLSRGEPLPQHELAYLTALLIERDTSARRESPLYTEVRHPPIAPVTLILDGATGNGMALLYSPPKGWEGVPTSVTVDAPGSATITPSAPYANAASWMYLAKMAKGQQNDIANANAANARIRDGACAFAPDSAAGPIIPGQWTYNQHNLPPVMEGEVLVFAIVGGSIAALQGLQLQITVRIDEGRRAVS